MKLLKKLAAFDKRNKKIIAAFQSGKSKSELAREYGISRERVRQIIEKRTRRSGEA